MILFAECGLRNAGSKSRFRLRLPRFSIVIISIGEKSRSGGLVRRGAWVKDLRESEKGILFSDAGDLLFKKYLHPIPENELTGMAGKAHLIIESFNLMGYDALGIGDDDLTLGKEFLLEISRKANFPFLCSNLLDETSGKNWGPAFAKSYFFYRCQTSFLGETYSNIPIFRMGGLNPHLFLTASVFPSNGIVYNKCPSLNFHHIAMP